MTNKSLDSIVLRYAGFLLIFLALGYLLYLSRGALPVFVIGGVIAFAFEPLLQRMERNGRSRRASVALVFALYLTLGAIVLSLLAAAFQQGQTFLTNAGSYNKQLTQIVEKNRAKLNDSKIPKPIKESINEALDSNLKGLSKHVTEVAPGLATSTIAGVGTFLINTFLITLISFGLMLEAPSIKARMLMLLPPMYRRDATELTGSINELLGRYVRGQLIVCSTFGGLCTVAFEILSRVYGMQYPLVIGICAVFLYILPYFGLAIILVASGLTAYLTASQPVPCTLAAVGCCIVFNLFVDYGVAPRVLGRGVGLHPLMIIFALLCGFEMGGPIGTIVAVPLLASLRVIAIYFFPQLAAPIQIDPPVAKTAQEVGHSQSSEEIKRTAEAEASLPSES